MKKIAILIVLFSSTCCRAQVPVGALVYSIAPIHSDKWFEADGRCLRDSDYPALADALHEGDNWPYGRCDGEHFRIPDLRPKLGKTAIPNIRVTP